mmetsp:Transcript_3170/g.11474  ORF Transcript_3170/g.11474 Transcript_3170/m.11474 type:complete len:311 (+) Transcript_3170:3-935(+)
MVELSEVEDEPEIGFGEQPHWEEGSQEGDEEEDEFFDAAETVRDTADSEEAIHEGLTHNFASAPTPKPFSFASAANEPETSRAAEAVKSEESNEVKEDSGAGPEKGQEQEEEDRVPEAERSVEKAEAHKREGNDHFGHGRHEEASLAYSEALRWAPAEAPERSVYLANRGACRMKQGRFKECVEDCTAALKLKPQYCKALLRRAQAREQLYAGELTSGADLAKRSESAHLERALEDYSAALELEPTNPTALEAKRRLQPKVEELREAMKTEMMSKLKDLGNMVLGNFGLSTDNFKFEQNEQGSYSVQFQP